MTPLHFKLLALAVAVTICSTVTSAADSCRGLPQLETCGQKLQTPGPFSKCFEKALNFAMKKLAPGVKAIGLATLDPLAVPGPIKVADKAKKTLTLTDCKLKGGIKSRIQDLTATFGVGIVYNHVLPTFKFTCTYTMDAGFLNLQGATKGTFTLTAQDYTNHFDIPAKLIQQCASKKTFAQFPQVKTSFTSAKGFTVKLSGVTGSQPTEAAIRPLLTPQLDKAGSSVIFEWLKVLLKHFPDVFTWVPPSGGDNEKFCLVQNQCA